MQRTDQCISSLHFVIDCLQRTEDTENMRKEMNFRDLGGIVTANGRTIRKGLLYRSCCPRRMNAEEQKSLCRQYQIKVILDLRTAYEAYEEPVPDIPGITCFRVSGMRDTDGEGIDFSPEGMRRMQEHLLHTHQDISEHMHDIYISMMFHNEAFMFLLLLLKDHAYPVLFHCATGKDRTGAVAMLLEMALGVRDNGMLDDYEQSNVAYQDKIENDFRKYEKELKGHPERREQIMMIDGVSRKKGEELLMAIKQRYSSQEEFLNSEYGLNITKLNEIRNAFTER